MVGFTCLKAAEPLRGDSFLFTIQSSGSRHWRNGRLSKFISFGCYKGWENKKISFADSRKGISSNPILCLPSIGYKRDLVDLTWIVKINVGLEHLRKPRQYRKVQA